MLRKKTIIETMELFTQHGIKNVSLEQIASHLHVSMDELTAIFPNMETLLTECIKNERKRLKQILNAIKVEEKYNTLEKFIMSMSKIYYYQDCFSSISIKELHDNQEVMDVIKKAKLETYHTFIQFLEQGVSEGYFKPDIKVDSIAALIINQMESDKKIQHPDISLMLLRSISTDKGLEVLKIFTAK